MKTAIYPGSFDPITVGHVDIIERISKIFDHVIVLISETPHKSYLFSSPERKNLIEESLRHLKNVSVDIHEGLTVDYIKKNRAQVIVRGLRAVVDFEYEMTMANINKKLDPELETLLVFASPETYYVSSRGVKEVARYNGSLEGLVPDVVKKSLMKKMK
ncbi:MAG: pantetheine-phosphate adenylyltransferase [Bdellovibrio sp. CG10_big_fil_rev_8_21_14_0_10_47_8]|nr:MAG: pantetheine-phosphate adenylyltransferase [Bdellovibrio sp. CG10_big_fil_rev_8_21_14_0_10_47_8]